MFMMMMIIPVDRSSSGNTVLRMGEKCTEEIFQIVYQ
jgi:hypothetical protein